MADVTEVTDVADVTEVADKKRLFERGKTCVTRLNTNKTRTNSSTRSY